MQEIKIKDGLPQGGARQKNKDKFNNMASLTTMWRGRYHVWSQRYKADTLLFFSLVQTRSRRNSFEIVTAKSDRLAALSGNELKYCKSLTSAFLTGIPYTANEITSKVCTARSLFGLPPFRGKDIQQQCVDLFYELFIAYEEMGVNNMSLPERKYKPMFALLPE